MPALGRIAFCPAVLKALAHVMAHNYGQFAEHLQRAAETIDSGVTVSHPSPVFFLTLGVISEYFHCNSPTPTFSTT
jgi:hypothetical protein